ncbi:MAG TPA: hopanoid biosynthesis-associated protein HpnK [Thermoanaerobaculia bacterium]|nr:hopanoid biosynthesis-associated protein HpnK [Thermoanaerobaculia bacterium]
MRTLAVTGDDFGSSEAVNRGIAEAHDRGILTRASLMVAGKAASEAVELARSRPRLAVGLHLVVVDGFAALPPRQVPNLVDSFGRFRGGPVLAGLRYQFSAAARRELFREIRAQLERFRDTGLPLSHVDGHHHMHLHPVVLRMLGSLAREFRIPEIRLPSEELLPALALDRSGAAAKVVSSAVFRLLRWNGKRRLSAAGIGFSERVYGLLATGRITEEYLLGLVPSIRAGRVELYCHPAVPRSGGLARDSGENGPRELAALTSRRVREAVRIHGFVLSESAGIPPELPRTAAR